MSDHDRTISFPAIPVRQPIGTFYVGVMEAHDLVAVSAADVRRLHESQIDTYIGIQRRLSPSRIKELKAYVQSFDATFPTAVILAVSDENALWDAQDSQLTFLPTEKTPLNEVASIIDGQHRVDGLNALSRDDVFQVPVAVFVGADVATQANIFATVNLAQTKVNRSLVYDLLDYEKKRSPQKSAHHITVALDKLEVSPFHKRIKRLGSATPGRDSEAITQAVMVEALLDLMSSDPMADRNSLFQAFSPNLPSEEQHQRYPFRQLFLKSKETDITRIVLAYFTAVAGRWPNSWQDLNKRGNVLPKTNGVKALMRFLRVLYLRVASGQREYVPQPEEFADYLKLVPLDDDSFNTETFPPGTSGEAALYRVLMASLPSELPGLNLKLNL